MFEDIGIGVCSCGVERRLYKPERGPVLCLPCTMAAHGHRGRYLADCDAVDKMPSKSTVINRERRQRLYARGLCIDCGRLPHLRDVKRCMKCHTKMLGYGKAAS